MCIYIFSKMSLKEKSELFLYTKPLSTFGGNLMTRSDLRTHFETSLDKLNCFKTPLFKLHLIGLFRVLFCFLWLLILSVYTILRNIEIFVLFVK